MTSYLLAGPAEEPVGLALAKSFLRIEDEAEDGLIETLVVAARLHIEGVTGRAVIEQSWRLVLDDWPRERVVRLPVAPLVGLEAIRVFDRGGTAHPVDLDAVLPDGGAVPARIILPSRFEGVPSMRERNGVEIDYVAGLAATAEAVPEDLKHALLSLVAYWFEHRDAVIVAGSGALVPAGFDRLIANYRRARL